MGVKTSPNRPKEQVILLWRSMLNGDMNNRYWRYRANRYTSMEKAAKIFLAVTSSATVAGWTVWHGAPAVWQTLSAISAVIAVALPILDFPGQSERASDLRQRWISMSAKYDQLWAEACDARSVSESIKRRWNQIRQEQEELAKVEAKFFKRDVSLLKKCQKEVIEARGLPDS